MARKNAANCGTLGGHTRHKRAGEPPCEACRDARRAYDRAKRAEARAALEKSRDDSPTGKARWGAAECGTPAGYWRHRREETTPCDDCKAARAAYELQRKHRKRREAVELGPPTCGEPRMHLRHKRRGEDCATCHEAFLEHRRAKEAAKRAALRPDPGECLSCAEIEHFGGLFEMTPEAVADRLGWYMSSVWAHLKTCGRDDLTLLLRRRELLETDRMLAS